MLAPYYQTGNINNLDKRLEQYAADLPARKLG